MNKKKLLSAFLMLLITAVALTTASYAWFTENTTVTVSDLDVQVDATNGIQISTDGITWKTSLETTDITTGYSFTAADASTITDKNQLPSKLVAVSSGGVVTTATGATKGQLELFKGAIDSTTGTNYLTSEATRESKGTTGDFIVFDLFIQTTIAEDIYLSTGSNVVAREGTQDKGLKNAARVAFLNEGNVPVGSTQEAITTLNGATTAWIWEPNSDYHTAAGIANHISVYGNTNVPTETTVVGSYPGFISEFAVGAQVPLNATATSDPTHFATVTTDLKTPVTITSSSHLFAAATKIPAGVTKLRIYMWVEGQDIDCENNASGTDITFKLQLSKTA